MKKLTRLLFTIALTFSLLALPTKAFAQAKIQLAILLDSSNSMDGLIDQTRTQIWQIVNALTQVTKDGQVPELEIARLNQQLNQTYIPYLEAAEANPL
ncbi:MAG: hypothetical protein RLP02_14760 [Coleofasciculus sp. C2-GNP5-27]